MKRIDLTHTITIGFAFFAVLFGAGNIIFPLQIGAISGNKAFYGVISFLFSGIGLPLLGLTGAVLFNGDYKAFFNRIGKIPGSLLLLFCMLALGPGIAIPRLITLSYEMLEPIFPNISLLGFSAAVLLGTFLIGIHKEKIFTIISTYLAPLVFLVAIVFIGMGITTVHPAIRDITPSEPTLEIIRDAFTYGYSTLDLIAAFFFGCYFFTSIKKLMNPQTSVDVKKINHATIMGTYIGILLLALVTIGFCLLGLWYGNSLGSIATEQYLNAIMNKLFGNQGMIFTTATVLLACASTITMLSTVVADYLHQEWLANKAPYFIALALVLFASIIPSIGGLQNLLFYSEPIINHAYPTIIMLVICNVLYKTYGFEHIKLPTFIVFSTVMMHYIHKITGF